MRHKNTVLVPTMDHGGHHNHCYVLYPAATPSPWERDPFCMRHKTLRRGASIGWIIALTVIIQRVKLWFCSVNLAPCMASMEPSMPGTTISPAGQSEASHKDTTPLIPLVGCVREIKARGTKSHLYTATSICFIYINTWLKVIKIRYN